MSVTVTEAEPIMNTGSLRPSDVMRSGTSNTSFPSCPTWSASARTVNDAERPDSPVETVPVGFDCPPTRISAAITSK